jgi:hypothetical protein
MAGRRKWVNREELQAGQQQAANDHTPKPCPLQSAVTLTHRKLMLLLQQLQQQPSKLWL